MKQANEIIISVYSNVYSKQPVSKSLQEVLGDCLRPVYEPLIRSIRRYHEEGRTEDVQQLKKKLPCFTPSGEFDGAHAIRNLRRHSNVICLDYDHVDHRLEMLRKIAEDEHTLCVLESPTDGLKVFVYVEQVEGHHRKAQALVSRYYRELTGLESDMACKDESRLCYFTYSPNGYLAGLCQPFEFSYASGSKNAEAEARQTADTGGKSSCRTDLHQQSGIGGKVLFVLSFYLPIHTGPTPHPPLPHGVRSLPAALRPGSAMSHLCAVFQGKDTSRKMKSKRRYTMVISILRLHSAKHPLPLMREKVHEVH